VRPELPSRSSESFLAKQHQRRQLAIVAVATALALAPFVTKPFHIDDPLFVWSAKQIQRAAGAFYSFQVNWYGTTQSAADVIKNPPLASYYISLVAYFFGWSEVTLHLAFVIPAIACTTGVYRLARRLCSTPLLPALCLLVTPAFVVSSTNLMCDTMLLALWIWSVVFWLEGLDRQSGIKLTCAAFLIGIAGLTKYFGICLIPLLFVHGIAAKRKLGVWCIVFVLPILMFAVYESYTRHLYGHGLMLDAVRYAGRFSHRNFSAYTISGLAFTGGCILIPLFFAHLLWSNAKIIGGFAIAMLCWLLFAGTRPASLLGGLPPASLNYIIPQIALFAVVGMIVLLLPSIDAWKSRNPDSLLLLFWVGGTFVFATFLNWTVNARSVLPMAPAIAVALSRRLDQVMARRQVAPRLFWPLLPIAAVTLVVTLADFRLASANRAAAYALNAKRPSSLGSLWFQGHWGFQYYMEAVGAQPLDIEHGVVENGDLLAVPPAAPNIYSLPSEVLRLVDAVEMPAVSGVSAMGRSLGAGFYSSDWGPLPFAFGPNPPLRYELFSVTRELRFRPPSSTASGE